MAGGGWRVIASDRRCGRPFEEPGFIPATANKQLASRYHQLKTGHYLTSQCLEWVKS